MNKFLTLLLAWSMFTGFGVAGSMYVSHPGGASFTNLYAVDNKGLITSPAVGANFGNILSKTNTDAFSLSIWVNYDQIGSPNQYHSLFDKMDTLGNNLTGYQLYTADGTIGFQQFNNVNTSNYLAAHTGTVLTAGSRYNVILTKGAGSNVAALKIYINGSSSALTTDLDALSGSSATSVNFWIGSQGRDSLSSLNGTWDEASVWNKELSAGEVTDIYNGGTAGNLSAHSAVANLTDWWRGGDNDSGTGTTMTAAVGGHNGTLTTNADYVPNTFYSATVNGGKQTAANNASIDFAKANSFSGGAWIRTTSANNQGVISKTKAVTSQGYLLQLTQATNPPSVRFFLLDATTQITYSTSTNKISANTWYHVGWSYDGSGLASGIKIYINGALETAAATADGIVTDINGAADLVIGANDNGTDQFFIGRIDEPFIVGGVLSGANFAAINRAGHGAATLASFSPLVWLKEENNNSDSGSLGLSFTDTSVSYTQNIIP